ncbi:MAG: hypothetical protein FJ128_10155 [Deltaproteobacteria bacterium]|nr:hypothetical protein [Deltaproteobacteria bacterium]
MEMMEASARSADTVLGRLRSVTAFGRSERSCFAETAMISNRKNNLAWQEASACGNHQKSSVNNTSD